MTDAVNTPPTTRAARVITIVATTLCAFYVAPYALVRGTIGRR
ncbi:hypothetical protein [Streptomyces sp. NPDC002394]